LRYPFCPQPPTENDTQSQAEYLSDYVEFENRNNCVEGCHVKPQYTAMAHYMLLLWQLNVNEWCFVSDDDSTIQSCIFKVFSEKLRDGKAIYFTRQYGYAKMALTIIRTFYNFCWKRKYGVGVYMTPVRRLGITEKVFEYEDIVYYR
jgi:hypothetical protein